MSKHPEVTLFVIGLLMLSAPTAHAEAGREGRGVQLLEMFDSADTDKDGKLSGTEWKAFRLAEFTAADTNADGSLGADELKATQLLRMISLADERTARMIEKLDANADGSLSAAEFPGPAMGDHFARLDSDEDGAISKTEAQVGFKWFAEWRKKRNSDEPAFGEN